MAKVNPGIDQVKMNRFMRLLEKYTEAALPTGLEFTRGHTFSREGTGVDTSTGVQFFRLSYSFNVNPKTTITWVPLPHDLGVYDLDKAIAALAGLAPIRVGVPFLPVLLARLYPARYGPEWD